MEITLLNKRNYRLLKNIQEKFLKMLGIVEPKTHKFTV
jgi:hypothetical protein